jgi:hypothetical protein
MFAAKRQAESNIPPIPKGTYQAVCYGVIDIGTQYSEIFDNESHKFIVLWEIPKLKLKLKDRNGGEKIVARTISKTYSLSIGKKSNFRADLISWFGQEPEDNYDPRTLLEQNCLLTIAHKVSQTTQKIRANVSSIAGLMDGMATLKPENSILSYIIEENGLDIIPSNIPTWIADEIKKSKEYGIAHDIGSGVADADAPPPTDDDIPPVTNNDNIPF